MRLNLYNRRVPSPKVWGAFLYISSGCKIHEWLQIGNTVLKLITDFDSDAHKFEYTISPPPQSDSDTEEDRDRLHRVDWHYKISTFCTYDSPFGLRQNEAPNIKTLPHWDLFLEIMQLMVEETNRYDHQYLDTFDKEHSSLPCVNIQKCTYFYLLVWVTNKDYSSSLFQFFATFMETMKCDSPKYWDFYIFLPTKVNLIKRDENYDRLWKMITILH